MHKIHTKVMRHNSHEKHDSNIAAV